MGGMLCVASFPTAAIGTINSATGLVVVRAFIGIAGATFVPCQYWASRMFTKEVRVVASSSSSCTKRPPFARFSLFIYSLIDVCRLLELPMRSAVDGVTLVEV